jgi:TRAP transporter 4TM/12TM fusion protein
MRVIASWLRLSTVISVVAIAMVIYQLSSVMYLWGEPVEHWNRHLAFAFVLVFLKAIQKSKKFVWFDLLLLVLSIAATSYIAISYQDLLDRLGFPNTADVIVGVVLILLCLEGTRRSYGNVLPVLVICYIIYAFFGYLFPEPFETIYYPAAKIIGKLAVLQGVYGMVLGISADYIFLFIIFGAVLEVSGATQFFNQVGRVVGRHFRSGPAASAVTCSSLVGMCTGSVIANIILIGSFTIPLMKRAGYKPHQAAAIEATASTGGQIMPPVMGATAFIMSGITGIPYIKICAAAAIPAVFYYFSIGLYAEFQARKIGITSLREEVDKRELLITAPLFLVPMAVLITLMILNYSPMYAVFWSLAPLVLLSLVRKKTRPSLKVWVESLTKGAISGAEVGVGCALIGIIVATTTMTGLGIKLPAAIVGLGAGMLPVVLIITAIVALILGCGITVAAVYILVAIMAVPALLSMGLTMMQSHLFAFYFAVMSFVTPPVALGSLFAAQVAQAKFWPTGIEATKVASTGFIVPFFMILCPAIILEHQPMLPALTGIISIIVILTANQVVFCNHYLAPVSQWERAVFLLITLVHFGSMITGNYVLFAVGLVVFIYLTVGQVKKGRILFPSQKEEMRTTLPNTGHLS